MSKKEELLEQLGESYGYIEQSIESNIELAKIKLTEKSVVAFSSLASAVILGVLLVFVLFCLILAAGFGLAALLGSPALAFLVLAAFFTIIGIVFIIFRKALVTNPITSLIIQKIFPKND